MKDPKQHPKFGDLVAEEHEPTPLPDEELIVRHSYGYNGATPQVSVVTLHHYQVPSWWRKFHDSVRYQTGLKSWELIEVKNFDNEFGTLGEARNASISRAAAPWVFFADDDDWLREDCLSAMLEQSDGFDAVQCAALIVDSDGKPWERWTGTLGLVRKSLFDDDQVGPFKRINLMEDYDWQCRFDNAGLKRIFIDRPLYYYRMHKDQTSAALKQRVPLYEMLEEQGAKIE